MQLLSNTIKVINELITIGHLIWKEDEKQEKIMILLDGEVQELHSLN